MHETGPKGHKLGRGGIKGGNRICERSGLLARPSARQLDRLQREVDALRAVTADFDPFLPERGISADWIRDMLRAKRRRDAIFAQEGFGDPGWDLLVALYSSELVKEPVSTSDLCAAASVAHTPGSDGSGNWKRAG